MDIHLFFKILNFLLFVGLLAFFLRRPLKEFWRNRAEALRHRIGEAFKKRSRAEAECKNLMSRLNRMDYEMRELTRRMKGDGELEKQKIIEQAKDYATKLEAATGRIAGQELQKATERLKTQAARAAVDLARRLIQERITPKDQRRLTKNYLDRLAAEDFPPLAGGLA